MDTTRWAFETALAREGKEVTDHIGATHKVMFRRSRDKNSTDDYLTIFASYDSGIQQGETLSLDDGKILIVLNSETESGRQYRRLDAVRSNGMVSLCYTEKKMDEKHNTITVDTSYAESVPIFIVSGLTVRRLSDLSGSDLQFILPARYGFSIENTVKMNVLSETKNHEFKTVQGIFQPATIDYHLMRINADGTRAGLLSIRGSADLRPRG